MKCGWVDDAGSISEKIISDNYDSEMEYAYRVDTRAGDHDKTYLISS